MSDLNKKKLFAYSAANGCLTNLLETTSFRNSLDTNNYQQVENIEDSDVIFINTCGYNNQAEKNSLNVIEDFQKKYPEKKLIVSGCLPRINKQAVQKAFAGPIVSTGELHKMNDLLNEPIIRQKGLEEEAYYLDEKDLQTRLSSNRLLEHAFPMLLSFEKFTGKEFHPLHNIFDSASFDKNTFAISVSRGCLGKCNYCAIKKAKGSLISRPLPEIITRIQRALDEGANKIHILGDDIGCWGQDLNLNSSHLLSAILRLNYNFKLVINYFDPTWMNKYFKDLEEHLSNPKIICVNIPIQSANNNIIKKMDRDYKIEDVFENINKLKKNNPLFVAKTHIMVGYPTETNSEFLDSLKAVSHFDLIFANKYGIRPGTPAEKMPQVHEAIKEYRFKRLQMKILNQHAKTLFKSFITPPNTTRLQISYE
ncbi:radical SAM protein [bacterium]|nr:radical SAM protein [bacterium]